jgi:hypothetical protein
MAGAPDMRIEYLTGVTEFSALVAFSLNPGPIQLYRLSHH